MSEISDKMLDDWQRDIEMDPKSFTSWPLNLLATCIEEIRRLRADNAELKKDSKRLNPERCTECGIVLVPDNICSDCFHARD